MTAASHDARRPWALVTGAAGDLGVAIARGLAADGFDLVLSDLGSRVSSLDAAALAGVEVETHGLDVTDDAAVEGGLQELVSRLGAPTVVVANAGIQGEFVPLHHYPVADARRVLEVNVIGVFGVVSVAAAAMQAEGRQGSIVLTASMAGVGGAPNMAAYSASKAAVIALAKSAAKDLAPFGIRVNSVSPAFIGPGAMWDRQVQQQAAAASQYYATDADTVAQQMIDLIPLRRYGSPDEVADVVCWLAGDRSSYITGQNIEVSGGSV